jgi:hypothetical protein
MKCNRLQKYNMWILNVAGHTITWLVEVIWYKDMGSIPIEVTGFFNWPNPSSSTMAVGSTQPLTEMSMRNLPGSKQWPAHKADNLIATCVHSKICTFTEPSLNSTWKLEYIYKISSNNKITYYNSCYGSKIILHYLGIPIKN